MIEWICRGAPKIIISANKVKRQICLHFQTLSRVVSGAKQKKSFLGPIFQHLMEYWLSSIRLGYKVRKLFAYRQIVRYTNKGWFLASTTNIRFFFTSRKTARYDDDRLYTTNLNLSPITIVIGLTFKFVVYTVIMSDHPSTSEKEPNN